MIHALKGVIEAIKWLDDVDIVLGEAGLLDSGINFMMYVYDWDGQDMDFNWDYIKSDYPTS